MVGSPVCAILQFADYYRSILHDPAKYPDPDRFIPERFLTAEGEINPEVQDPTVACFGFGRRFVVIGGYW